MPHTVVIAAFPAHLLLPLLASLLFACGLVFIKQATQRGVGSWTVTFVANMWAMLLFSTLRLLGGAHQPWQLYWQPATIALLFISGQVCTFWAINRGDVSVAAPIFSVKVLMVAIFLTVVAGAAPNGWVWLAAVAATIGVALIQRSSRAGRHQHVTWTICMALAAATNYALFDVLVQRWAPAWGPGHFISAVFWIAGALSLGFLPWSELRALTQKRMRGPLLAGSFLFALQSFCIVIAIGLFGDAARVNIVYALRGIWGVGIAWMLAGWLESGEADASRSVMISRLAGATLVTTAVIIALVVGK